MNQACGVPVVCGVMHWSSVNMALKKMDETDCGFWLI